MWNSNEYVDTPLEWIAAIAMWLVALWIAWHVFNFFRNL